MQLWQQDQERQCLCMLATESAMSSHNCFECAGFLASPSSRDPCLPHGVGGTKHSTTGSSSAATFFKIPNLYTLNTQSVTFRIDLFIDSLFAVALITLTLLLWSVFWVFCVQWDRRAYVSVAVISASTHLSFFILWGYYPGWYLCLYMSAYFLRCGFLWAWVLCSILLHLLNINIYQGVGMHIITHWRSEGSFRELALSFHHTSTGVKFRSSCLARTFTHWAVSLAKVYNFKSCPPGHFHFCGFFQS